MRTVSFSCMEKVLSKWPLVMWMVWVSVGVPLAVWLRASTWAGERSMGEPMWR